jgi:hypothetical protein
LVTPTNSTSHFWHVRTPKKGGFSIKIFYDACQNRGLFSKKVLNFRHFYVLILRTGEKCQFFWFFKKMRFFAVFFEEMMLLAHQFNITKNRPKSQKSLHTCHKRWHPVVWNHIFSKISKNRKIDIKKIFLDLLLTGVTVFAHFCKKGQFWSKMWHALARSGFFEVSKNSRGSPKK